MNAVWIPASQARTGDCWRASLDQTYALRVERKTMPDGRVRLEYNDEVAGEYGFIELEPQTAILVVR